LLACRKVRSAYEHEQVTLVVVWRGLNRRCFSSFMLCWWWLWSGRWIRRQASFGCCRCVFGSKASWDCVTCSATFKFLNSFSGLWELTWRLLLQRDCNQQFVAVSMLKLRLEWVGLDVWIRWLRAS